MAHLRYEFLKARELLTELATVLDRCPPVEQTCLLRADLCHRAAVSERVSRDFDQARDLLR